MTEHVRADALVVGPYFAFDEMSQPIADRPITHLPTTIVAEHHRAGHPESGSNVVEEPAQYQRQIVEHRHPTTARPERQIGDP